MGEVMEDDFDNEDLRAFEARGSIEARIEALELCVMAIMGQVTKDDRQGASLIHTLRGLAVRHRLANGHSEAIAILEVRADGLERTMERRRRRREAS